VLIGCGAHTKAAALLVGSGERLRGALGSRPLSLAEALALDDELLGVVGQPIERALRQDRVVEDG